MGKGRRPIDTNDLVGKRAGSMVVESYSHKEVVKVGEINFTHHYYNCKCDCGNEEVLRRDYVKRIIGKNHRCCMCIQNKERRYHSNDKDAS